MLVQQFSNCCKPKPQLPSGFFLKKKSPCVALGGAHELENCSRPWGQPSPAIRVCRPASRQSPISRTKRRPLGRASSKTTKLDCGDSRRRKISADHRIFMSSWTKKGRLVMTFCALPEISFVQ